MRCWRSDRSQVLSSHGFQIGKSNETVELFVHTVLRSAAVGAVNLESDITAKPSPSGKCPCLSPAGTSGFDSVNCFATGELSPPEELYAGLHSVSLARGHTARR